jgi:ubiquinone/menaquinone biosynthesis C-methylase UbiE
MKKLNFGCGNDIKPKKEGWINVDIQKGKGIDKSFDFEKAKYPFKDSEFDYIYIDNVFEHLINLHDIVKELHRITKKNGTIEIIVPYYNSYWAYSDPTHVHYFNEVCMEQTFRVRSYENKKNKELFEITELGSVPQRFLRWIPKPILNVLKRFLGNVIVELRVKVKVLK